MIISYINFIKGNKNINVKSNRKKVLKVNIFIFVVLSLVILYLDLLFTNFMFTNFLGVGNISFFKILSDRMEK